MPISLDIIIETEDREREDHTPRLPVWLLPNPVEEFEFEQAMREMLRGGGN
jgi:hypothetical protein